MTSRGRFGEGGLEKRRVGPGRRRENRVSVRIGQFQLLVRTTKAGEIHYNYVGSVTDCLCRAMKCQKSIS